MGTITLEAVQIVLYPLIAHAVREKFGEGYATVLYVDGDRQTLCLQVRCAANGKVQADCGPVLTLAQAQGPERAKAIDEIADLIDKLPSVEGKSA